MGVGAQARLQQPVISSTLSVSARPGQQGLWKAHFCFSPFPQPSAVQTPTLPSPISSRPPLPLSQLPPTLQRQMFLETSQHTTLLGVLKQRFHTLGDKTRLPFVASKTGFTTLALAPDHPLPSTPKFSPLLPSGVLTSVSSQTVSQTVSMLRGPSHSLSPGKSLLIPLVSASARASDHHIDTRFGFQSPQNFTCHNSDHNGL